MSPFELHGMNTYTLHALKGRARSSWSMMPLKYTVQEVQIYTHNAVGIRSCGAMYLCFQSFLIIKHSREHY